jgi:hypothetical protein
MDIGVLEHWPLDNPASNYRIIRGNPVTSGRLDQGATGDRTRLGLWRCTQGAFECTELGDELQTILSGRVRLIRSDGTVREFGSGDTFFTHQGERVTWDIVEDVTKVFFGFSEGGF